MLADIANVNWLSVLVAAAAYFVLGAVWFTPLLGRVWDVATGHARAKGEPFTPIYYVAPLVTAVCVAVATAVVRAAVGVASVGDAVVLGLVVGVGYSAAVSLTNAVTPGIPRPLLFAAVTGGYHVVGAVTVAVILQLWA